MRRSQHAFIIIGRNDGDAHQYARKLATAIRRGVRTARVNWHRIPGNPDSVWFNVNGLSPDQWQRLKAALKSAPLLPTVETNSNER